MKTAISIPDKIFESAEQLAHRLGQSRSHLYAQALSTYLEKHRGDHITQKLNEVYSDVDPALDPAIHSLQAQALPREDW